MLGNLRTSVLSVCSLFYSRARLFPILLAPARRSYTMLLASSPMRSVASARCSMRTTVVCSRPLFSSDSGSLPFSASRKGSRIRSTNGSSHEGSLVNSLRPTPSRPSSPILVRHNSLLILLLARPTAVLAAAMTSLLPLGVVCRGKAMMYLVLFACAVAHVLACQVSSARPTLDSHRGPGLSLQEQVVQYRGPLPSRNP